MIYCKTCKWSPIYMGLLCYPKHPKFKTPTYLKPNDSPVGQHMSDLNRNNDCSYYRRRRWMFWVKY